MEKKLSLTATKLAHMPIVFPVIKKIICLNKINELYASARSGMNLTETLEHILHELNIKLDYLGSELANIPKKEPVLIVANHPFGGIEGIALAAILLKLRQDVKILANYLLTLIEPIADLFISVDPIASKKNQLQNILGLQKAKAWLENGGLLCVFPAGTVSHWQWRENAVRDPAWNKTISRLADISGATVVPVFFPGKNTWYFNVAGIISPYLRTLLLPQQFFCKKNSTITLRMGNPIPPSRLKKIGNLQDKIDYLRNRTYLLSYRTQKNNDVQLQTSNFISTKNSSELKHAELNRLPSSSCLVDQDDLAVYYARAHDIPELLMEIAHLREAVFSAAGEGTGNDYDLDRFDKDYLHLFVWHKKENRIIGAYRLGLTDYLLKKYGVKGLYLSTLYDVSNKLMQKINPAIELGRSFIVSDYQKKPLPLLLLWKAILQFIMLHPRYISIYGMVSISKRYQKLSRDLLVNFLIKNHLHAELMPLVKAKSGYKTTVLPHTVSSLLKNCHDLKELDTLIGELEDDKKGLPILLKQYLNMNACVLGFNLDNEFNQTLDCLCFSYVEAMPHKKIQYYIGKNNWEEYLRYHAKG